MDLIQAISKKQTEFLKSDMLIRKWARKICCNQNLEGHFVSSKIISEMLIAFDGRNIERQE